MAKYRVKQIGDKYYPQIKQHFFGEWKDIILGYSMLKTCLANRSDVFNQDSLWDATQVIKLHKSFTTPVIIHKID